jgi:hypothetical protein
MARILLIINYASPNPYLTNEGLSKGSLGKCGWRLPLYSANVIFEKCFEKS